MTSPRARRSTARRCPIRFAGVENQYFAIFMAPYPAPTGQEDRIDSKTEAVLLHKDETSLQKSDVGVRLSSKPLKVGPNTPVIHTYRVFLGPKTPEALAAKGGRALRFPWGQRPSSRPYRKSIHPRGLSWIARNLITPGPRRHV